MILEVKKDKINKKINEFWDELFKQPAKKEKLDPSIPRIKEPTKLKKTQEKKVTKSKKDTINKEINKYWDDIFN